VTKNYSAAGVTAVLTPSRNEDHWCMLLTSFEEPFVYSQQISLQQELYKCPKHLNCETHAHKNIIREERQTMQLTVTVDNSSAVAYYHKRPRISRTFLLKIRVQNLGGGGGFISGS